MENFEEKNVIAFDFGTIVRGPIGPQGEKGEQGDRGEKGETGATGARGEKGDKGDNGDTGAPFQIYKLYPTIIAMHAGYATDGVPVGGFVLIDTGNVEDEDNAKLFVKGETRYEYLTDLSGAQGIQGPKGENGKDGKDGIDGADGITPVRGVDYWTSEDQQAIYDDVKQETEEQQANIKSRLHAAEDEIDRLTTENKLQAFQIADLKAIVHDTVISDFEHTFEALDIANHPTHISDGTNYHPVLPNGACEFVSMEGKSVVSENLLPTPPAITKTEYGVTWSVASDGRVTASGTATNYSHIIIGGVTLPAGTYYLYFFGTQSNTVYEMSSFFSDNSLTNKSFTLTETKKVNIDIKRNNNSAVSMDGYFMISKVAPTEYKPYFDGIKSVLAQGMQINGQNLWDEEWEVGAINPEGNKTDSTDGIRSKNFTKIEPNSILTYTYPRNKRAYIVTYDADKKFIERIVVSKSAITVSSNAHYFKICTRDSYGTTYNHDIAIILGTQGSYTPYKAPFYIPFGEPIELKGAGTAGDRIYIEEKEDGTFDIVIEKPTEKYTFTGSEEWFNYGSGYRSPCLPFTSFNTEVSGATPPSAIISNSLTLTSRNAIGAGVEGWSYSEVTVLSNTPLPAGTQIIVPLATPNKTTLATGLTENQVATLIEKYGSVEVVGNTNDEFVKPDVTMLYQVTKAIES